VKKYNTSPFRILLRMKKPKEYSSACTYLIFQSHLDYSDFQTLQPELLLQRLEPRRTGNIKEKWGKKLNI
jgi:hypothetical protein